MQLFTFSSSSKRIEGDTYTRLYRFSYVKYEHHTHNVQIINNKNNNRSQNTRQYNSTNYETTCIIIFMFNFNFNVMYQLYINDEIYIYIYTFSLYYVWMDMCVCVLYVIIWMSFPAGHVQIYHFGFFYFSIVLKLAIVWLVRIKL